MAWNSFIWLHCAYKGFYRSFHEDQVYLNLVFLLVIRAGRYKCGKRWRDSSIMLKSQSHRFQLFSASEAKAHSLVCEWFKIQSQTRSKLLDYCISRSEWMTRVAKDITSYDIIIDYDEWDTWISTGSGWSDHNEYVKPGETVCLHIN